MARFKNPAQQAAVMAKLKVPSVSLNTSLKAEDAKSGAVALDGAKKVHTAEARWNYILFEDKQALLKQAGYSTEHADTPFKHLPAAIVGGIIRVLDTGWVSPSEPATEEF